MNKHARILALAFLGSALTHCSPYDRHEAKVTTRMMNQLQDERAYLVTGVVGKPGKYPVEMPKEIKVSQAIQQAGGFAQFANKRRVILRRGHGSFMQRIFINFDKGPHGMRATPDIVIRGGDVIIVEELIVIF